MSQSTPAEASNFAASLIERLTRTISGEPVAAAAALGLGAGAVANSAVVFGLVMGGVLLFAKPAARDA